MKKIICTLIFILPMLVNSQQLHYGSGGTVYNAENKKIKPNEVRLLLANDSIQYNSGRDKKTWGNALFYGGLALVATNVIIAYTENTITGSYYNPNDPYSSPSISTKRTSKTMAIIGGTFVLASIPIKIGYPKKIKSAIAKYNKGITGSYKPTRKLTFIASNEQYGFRFEF